jgi:hypothetical protein
MRLTSKFSLVVLIQLASSTTLTACDSPNCTCDASPARVARERGCWLATSTNFRVCSFSSENEATEVAARCEDLRTSLIAAYGIGIEVRSWTPKCSVYLFPNKHKYGAAVGRQARETLGSSLVTPESGAVKDRRIDLRTEVPKYLQEVLPHEMTHVLIADLFREGPPPLWYDEGMALLTDSQSKQSLHHRDLRAGINRGTAFSVSELLTAQQYPAADRVSVFYGQCASLARWLCREQPPEKIHQFAKRSQEIGVNLALQECYGIAGLSQLEQKWQKSLDSPVGVTLAQVSLSK